MKTGRIFVFATAAVAWAQPQFEVVSVKPNTGVERGVAFGFPSPGRFHAQNVWLRFLIQNAWNVKDYQVVSGPGWAGSERYDIDAKADAGASREQMRLMIQTLLRDRFHLELHHESRSLPVYVLAASKDGSKLRASAEGSCVGGDCGGTQWSPRSLSGTAISMQQFTAMLENILQRPVIDKTGFAGRFDVRLSWVADQSTPGLLAPGVAPDALPSSNDAGPTIFNVLRDQLGLRLQAARGPVDILVIDRAEKPSAN